MQFTTPRARRRFAKLAFGAPSDHRAGVSGSVRRGMAVVIATATAFLGMTPIVAHATMLASTFTVSSNHISSVWGQAVTLTATIDNAAAVPTGTMTFMDGPDTMAAPCDVAIPLAQVGVSTAASAPCVTSSLSVGSHLITAVYSGDPTYTGTTSAPAFGQTVNQSASAGSVASGTNPSLYSQSVTYTATEVASGAGAGTPSGNVAFFSDTVAIAGCGTRALDGGGVATCTTTLAVAQGQVGTHSITANYLGDGNFNANTSTTLTQQVNQASSSTVALAAVPSVWGESVTLTGTVSATGSATGTPAGQVQFNESGTIIAGCTLNPATLNGAGVGTCATTGLSVGTHAAITAVYLPGNGLTFAGSTSGAVSQVVGPAVTTTALIADVNPQSPSATVNLTGTVTVTAPGVGVPTGNVVFADGATTLCTVAAPANGITHCAATFAASGAHALTATYAGDGNFSGSAGLLTENIAFTSATTVGSSALSSTIGQNVTFTSTTTSGAATITGTVTFKDGSTAIICTGGTQAVNGGSPQPATCQIAGLSVGSHTITAVYPGDTSNLPSTSAGITQVVNAGNSQTALAAATNPIVSGQGPDFTATVTAVGPAVGTPAGTVNFTANATTITGCGAAPVSGGGIATCAGTAVLAAGSPDSIVAIFSATGGQFNGSTSPTLTEFVTPAATTIALNANTATSGFGQAVLLTATVSTTDPGTGFATGTVTFKDNGGSALVCTNSTTGVLASGVATCSVTSLTVGLHNNITAIYGTSDGNYAVSPVSAAVTDTVSTAGTSIAVTSSTGILGSVVNQPVTYTATVTPTSGSGPTGTITFKDGVDNIAACTNPVMLSANTCTLAPTYASAGSHSITAVYSGDANFSTSTSPAFIQTVSAAGTTLAVTSGTDPSSYGQTVTFTATITPSNPGALPLTGGTVSFNAGPVACQSIAGGETFDLATGIATCTTTLATSLPHGADTVTATYTGDTNFGSSVGSITETVNAIGTTTVVSLTAGTSPTIYGTSVTFTATVAPTANGAIPTGSVEFTADDTDIVGCGAVTVVAGSGNGTAVCTTAALPRGSRTILAIYTNVDGNFTGSTSDQLDQTVTKAPTTSTLVSSVNPSVAGQTVTFADTITSAPVGTTFATGTVTFRDGLTALVCGGATTGVLNAGGVATCAVPFGSIGSHSITAVYPGDSNYQTGSSNVVVQVVNQATTTTVVGSSVNPSVSGQLVTYTATVAGSGGGVAAGGTLVFSDGGVVIGACNPVTLPANTCPVTYASTGGSPHAITAVYGGDPNFATSTSAAISQIVNRPTLTITASSAAMTVGGTVPTITPGYSGFVTGPPTASPTTPPTCSTTATSASAVGSYPSTCLGAIDVNYTIAYVAGTVTVSAAAASPYLAAGVGSSDHGLWSTTTDGGYTSLGGVLTAAPAVTSVGGAPLYIGAGVGGHLWVRTNAITWASLDGGISVCIDNPAAAVSGGTLWVACHGSDGALWYASTAVSGGVLPHVSSWTSNGGTIVNGPAVAVVDGNATFFANGADGALWMSQPAGAWSTNGWHCIGHPGAATGGTTAYLACHGTDGQLWVATHPAAASWSAAVAMGGSLSNGVGIAATGAGATYFVEGTDSAIYSISSSAGPGSYTGLGGSVTYGVGATGLG